MIRALSTAASGMNALQTRLDVNANNIANAATAGFKRSRASFQDLMYQTTKMPGASTSADSQAPSGMQVGLGVRTVATQALHTQGELRQTGNQYDVAIEGRGFFVIDMPSGEQAYTRAGAFQPNAEGRLVNADGYALSSEIVVPPDAETVTIGSDGTVTATIPGDAEPVQLGQIELALFSNPEGLAAQGRSLFTETAASGTPITTTPGQAGVGTLSQGSLELSNVQVVEEMIDLISGQRAYEVNTRVIRAADEMLQQTANLR